ncbi:MAG TPA: biotin--[acetyl-CoA-carboxylase] ligase [Mycobacteriales bacterium]|nr:biotin--[acetyl-CoA-carboxylase] ligase [Mycobacteriales bacterium]
MYEELGRPPLQQTQLQRALADDPIGLWREVRVLAETASTNAVVADAAREGAGEGLVVVAESQTAGRGRLGRTWVSPARAGLTLSVLLRPQVSDPAEWGWLPLLAGLAAAGAVRAQAGLEAVVKWPNDVLVGERKLAGILAEAVQPGAVVIGVGLNVTTTAAELPPDVAATSLAVEGARTTDRSIVLRALLRSLASVYDAWQIDPAPQRDAYRAVCATLGSRVRLELPDGRSVVGLADDVDTDGRLVVDGTPYASADVVHLRGTDLPG